MRVEYINPFVEAAYNVLTEVLATEVKRGNLFLKSATKPVMGVAAIVGLAGEVEGRVLFDMSKQTAIKIASVMNMEELTEIDDLVKATISELANMITGQASIGLEKNGYSTDMSPPVLLIGHGASIATFNLTRLVVPLVVSFGEFAIDIAVKESA